MARTKDQARRRKELVTAATRVIARHGVGAVRLRDVADEAGLTSGAVLYYYDDLADLFVEVYQAAIDRFCGERQAAVDAEADQARRLGLALHAGIPTGPDDDGCRILYEFEALTFQSPTCAALMTAYVERQVALYGSLLEVGERTGAFTLSERPETVARNLVALEDGHGIYVLMGRSRPAQMEATIRSYLAGAVGLPYEALDHDCPSDGRQRLEVVHQRPEPSRRRRSTAGR
jgi:AcrR family transcriptional regulator